MTYFTNNIIVRHTNSYFLPVTEYLRQPAVCIKDKCKRSGQISLHQLKGSVAYTGIFADIAQVVANNREVVFTRIDILQLADSFDRPFFQGMTTHSIHGIGGINDYPTVIQYIYNVLQHIGIVILGI